MRTLDDVLRRMSKLKRLAMHVERRPGAYWFTMMNSTLNVYGGDKWSPKISRRFLEKELSLDEGT